MLDQRITHPHSIPPASPLHIHTLVCTPICNREESLHHVTMVTKFLDLNKPWPCKYGRKEKKKKMKKIDMTFLCMIAPRSKMVAHTFLPSFNNINGHLCQERLSRFSLRKHLFLCALHCWGRFVRRNVCDSVTEIPY